MGGGIRFVIDYDNNRMGFILVEDADHELNENDDVHYFTPAQCKEIIKAFENGLDKLKKRKEN